MEHRKLGNSDLRVSPICMGCMGFGEAEAGMHRWAIGISNCFAWQLTKVTAPVVGATKLHHIEGAVKAAELNLTAEEIAYLEEPYVPHKLVGMMAGK